MKRGKHTLITGMPGSGKTTLFRRLADEMRRLNPVGFYTAEIRAGAARRGFRLCSLDGRTGILAHVEFRTGFKVGKYGIDVRGFDAFLNGLPLLEPKTGPVMIDEIGRMECLSDRFVTIVTEIVKSEKQLIATIAMKGQGFIADLKKRSDMQLLTLTRDNPDDLLDHLVQTFKVQRV